MWSNSKHMEFVKSHIFINADLLNLLAKFHRKIIAAASDGLIRSSNCQDEYFSPLRGLKWLWCGIVLFCTQNDWDEERKFI